MLWSAIYGLLALAAVLLARRSPLAGLAYALMSVWLVTFAEVHLLAVPLPVRALVYTWLMVGVTLAAAWSLVRYPAASSVIMTLSMIAGMMTFAYTRVGTDHSEVREIWSIGTNVMFGLSCLAIIITRIADVVDRGSGELDRCADDGRLAHGHPGSWLASEE